MPFTRDEWDAGTDFETFLAGVEAHADLWRRHWEKAAVDETTRRRLEDLPGSRRVLVISEDWCGDAVRTVPWLARAAAAAPAVELRVADIAHHEPLMDRHLSKGGRAIPVAIVEDGEGRDLGWWGPRPAPLQAVLRRALLEKGPPSKEERGAFYAPLFAWYAEDAGRTTLAEFVLLLERGPA